MALDRSGKRKRYYSERVKLELQAQSAFRPEVSSATRKRIAREIYARADELEVAHDIEAEWSRVLGWGIRTYQLANNVDAATLDEFLNMLEIVLPKLARARHGGDDVDTIQSLLADDLSSFRIQFVDHDGLDPALQIHSVENEHLQRDVVDRTFELTKEAGFESAQRDYAAAWGHYSRADLDDAVGNAHKAFESACKIIIKRVDPTSAPENALLAALVTDLVRLDILPQRMQHTVGQLEQIFRNAGTLRNAPGASHGSLGLETPEASTALFALRLAGSLIVFLVDRWKQMGSPNPP